MDGDNAAGWAQKDGTRMSYSCPAVDSHGNDCVLDEGHEGKHLRASPRNHVCHAIGCEVEVPPKMLMCLRHWRMVPKVLQARVWATYRPGQEIDKNPTGAYMEAQQAAVDAVAKKEGRL